MIKTYSFRIMDERMYLISEPGQSEAVVIDPFESDELYDDIAGFSKIYVLLTHHHFDHVSGVNALKEHFNCEVISTSACNTAMSAPNNDSRRFPFLFMNDKETFNFIRDNFKLPYICSADVTFDESMKLSVCGHDFELTKMPGHSPDCAIIMMDGAYLFAGDNVLGTGNELSFPDACKDEYHERMLPLLESLRDTDVTIMPGHGDPGSAEHFYNIIREYI